MAFLLKALPMAMNLFGLLKGSGCDELMPESAKKGWHLFDEMDAKRKARDAERNRPVLFAGKSLKERMVGGNDSDSDEECGGSKASGFIQRMMWETKTKHKGKYKNPGGLAPNSTMNTPASFKLAKTKKPSEFLKSHFTEKKRGRTDVDEYIARYAKEGLTSRQLAKKIKDEHGITVSHPTVFRKLKALEGKGMSGGMFGRNPVAEAAVAAAARRREAALAEERRNRERMRRHAREERHHERVYPGVLDPGGGLFERIPEDLAHYIMNMVGTRPGAIQDFRDARDDPMFYADTAYRNARDEERAHPGGHSRRIADRGDAISGLMRLAASDPAPAAAAAAAAAAPARAESPPPRGRGKADTYDKAMSDIERRFQKEKKTGVYPDAPRDWAHSVAAWKNGDEEYRERVGKMGLKPLSEKAEWKKSGLSWEDWKKGVREKRAEMRKYAKEQKAK